MRYLPLTEKDRTEMLQAIGVTDVDELYQDVPKEAILDELLDLPLHKNEWEVENILSAISHSNQTAVQGPFFLGAGSYYHHIPATVDHLIQRSEFLTAYTPYQPEISQGTLAAIFQFQTMIANLTGMEVANASMYDGATAVAEAAMMARRVTKRDNVVISGALHPQYKAVLETYMQNYNEVEITSGTPLDEKTACVIIQTPDFFGEPHDIFHLRKQCDEVGALLVVVVNEIVSLGLLPPPSDADIVVGEAQSIGMPMSFGGPHLGFFASKQKYIRQMPGRLCGETVDEDGKRSFVLTLNTREQHIRREKATSNICTNQGLCALAFTIHMSLLGEVGFKRLAKINHERACKLADSLDKIKGVTLINTSFFNEFAVKTSKNAKTLVEQLASENIIAGYAHDDHTLIVSATEMTSDDDIAVFVHALKEELE